MPVSQAARVDAEDLLELGPIVQPADQALATIATSSGMRSQSPQELRSRVEPYLWDYGITRVAHLTGFDFVGVPVHMAVKPQGRSLSSGSGKGVTTEASWISAVMECCEQAVWEALPAAEIGASAEELERAGFAVVDGRQCPQWSNSLWSPAMRIGWLPGWDIATGRQVWVPESRVGLPQRVEGRLQPFVSGSNGLASGAHVLEAVLNGLLEVVERDGIALYSGVHHAQRLDAAQALSATAPDLAERLLASGLQLAVADCTTEVGIPTIAAYLKDAPGGQAGPFKGAGAGMTTAQALVRAVTEAFQARCLIVAGARDDQFESQRSAAVARPAPVQAPAAAALNSMIELSHGSVREALATCVSMLKVHGFDQVIVLRHSDPQDPVQVVRVIIPGLEGYKFANSSPGPRARTWVPPTAQTLA